MQVALDPVGARRERRGEGDERVLRVGGRKAAVADGKRQRQAADDAVAEARRADGGGGSGGERDCRRNEEERGEAQRSHLSRGERT